MRVLLLTVGTRAPRWVREGFADYARRLPRDWRLEIEEVPAASRARADVAAARAREAAALRGRIPRGAWVVALDERGEPWDTRGLAERLARCAARGRPVAFLVGGPDGLDPGLRGEADACWSLSALTLPHALVRVVVAEQVYRAWTLLSGHPYHR